MSDEDSACAAVALFNAWQELTLLTGALSLTAWPLVLDAVEHELTRESVLSALPEGARSLVEQYVDVPRCRCGARLVRGDELDRWLCIDCAADFVMDVEHEVNDV